MKIFNNRFVKVVVMILVISNFAVLLSACDIKRIGENNGAASSAVNTYDNTNGAEVSASVEATHDNETAGNTLTPTETENKIEETTMQTPVNTPQATSKPTEKPVQTLSGAEKWIKRYEKLGKDGDRIIMPISEIIQFNKKLDAECESIVDILNMPETMQKSSVRAYIEAAECPSLPKYDWSGEEITETKRNSVISNRNLESLSGSGTVTLKRGIIVQRADLRTVPTDTPFFSSSSNNYYDRIQETELVVGSPVWILHESTDGRYFYVQAYHYCGWVIKTDIALAENETDWKVFANPSNFAVITSKLKEASSAKLDMGVRLPVVSMADGGFNVKIPKRSSEGKLYSATEFISANDANLGYLPYTMNNYYTQAFKYIGSIYGWGGSYDSVDCSGFVSAVMRSFGFYLPRNVSQQRTTCGNVINTDGMGASYIESKLSQINIPAAIYKPGHVMLYLGEIDGNYYIIHSPEGGRKVCEEVLNTSATNIKNINTFG